MTIPAARPLAVLFDLDGTLIDSIDLILDSARHAFRSWPGHRPSDEEWLGGVGIPLATMFRCYAAREDEVAQLIARYREHQMANHDRLVRSYEGVADTLSVLRARGHPVAVVTSKSDALAARGLTHVGINGLIDTVVGCDSCSRHKPHPEPVFIALGRLRCEPGEAVFVGDSVHDMEAGNAAGVTTIAALWGPFRREQLVSSGPRHFLDSIGALPALLDEIAGIAGKVTTAEWIALDDDRGGEAGSPRAQL